MIGKGVGPKGIDHTHAPAAEFLYYAVVGYRLAEYVSDTSLCRHMQGGLVDMSRRHIHAAMQGMEVWGQCKGNNWGPLRITPALSPSVYIPISRCSPKSWAPTGALANNLLGLSRPSRKQIRCPKSRS